MPSSQITASKIKSSLKEYINPEKAAFFPNFFKTNKGEYGYGDKFIGVTVPHQRLVAKAAYKDVPLIELEKLLQDSIHEYRLTALIILVYKYEKCKEEKGQKELVEFYFKNISYVNNWDLVDTSAPKILGPYLYKKNKSLLYEFAQSGELWKERIAILSTLYFIKKDDYTDALKISKLLLHHPHDLIHKSVGWMLREIGNRNLDCEIEFLTRHYKTMPRTMLRYAIEKFEPRLKEQFMKGAI